jgi:aquaporin Z
VDIVTFEPSATAVTGGKAAKAAAGRHSGLRYAVEAIGTFLLVFTVGAAVGSGNQLAPLAIGAVLVLMIAERYAGGRASAGHYNPAVTMALLLRRRIGLRDAGACWMTQIGAGLLAALVARAVSERAQIAPLATTTLTGRILVVAFVAELLFTFGLCYVVVDVADRKERVENSFYGLAIGLTVVAAAAVTRVFEWPTLSMYLLAQVIAGVAAGVIFLTLDPHETAK